MKSLFLKIVNYGIPKGSPETEAEYYRLVNGISFLGVPVSVTYFLLFAITGYFDHALAFLAGLVVFLITLPINKFFGLRTGRAFVLLMAPAFFAAVTLLVGRDAGFYLGFLVISIPPLIVFPTFREASFYFFYCVLLFIGSMLAVNFIEPLCVIPFAMGIYVFNVITVLFVSLTVVFFYRLQLSESKEKLEEKNREITDSINYARRIQGAILPARVEMESKLGEHFVLYRPKDIVAGDFYWMESIQGSGSPVGSILLAVADCTGHGVPGALVSVVCHNALNKALFEYGKTQTAGLLDQTRDFVVDQFNRNQNDVKDGMDISLLSLSPPDANGKVKVGWSGANNPLWIIRKGAKEVEEIKGDKQPVGKSEHARPFTQHDIILSPGDLVYIFSDGFADQFGGAQGKKFKSSAMKKLFVSVAGLSMSEQRKRMDEAFENWKGDLEQVDDVCVIGVRIA